ncbi:bifunctional DNA-binding transcriptional regulator/O6-methylguanine-DNA methyltransferase Ada [soil metagenome]
MQASTMTGKTTRLDNDEGRWKAVLDRDYQAEGRFFYGVTTTGIFCRPTCPSRRPAREHVRFFDTVVDARRGGFRPCKRCQPESVAADKRVIQQVVRAIESWDEGSPTLAGLSEIVGISPGHLQRKFKKATGVSPAEYARQRRLERLRGELKEGRDVTSSIYEAGFESPASLYESTDRALGMTPSNYRSGGKDVQIDFVIGDTPLGRLLLAVTDKGVASIQIGQDDADLIAALSSEFPRATIERIESSHPWFQVILDYLRGEIPHPDLPVDVQGTAFQRRVWQAIRVIPSGETRSYSQIAADIGNPEAVRAVANACANNRVALVIPCHRVVRADGSSGGYRWGEARKAALLSHEAGSRL